ncbi:hypothetical protein J2Z76_002053 [Sedimentibacter acidaminivorans]|uniref:SLH domain-containing protein n=1 Tax=Sedimentibacter acidaminivorans TaxID=913099 RepID=A0ABS4GES5_9FIRM|nr:S-layer homology domain-containing protein [Sedimentibacter acidaminivorans]MBP1926189.1 hypothetical protein [Sedimentibacter acidaminivorans]
MKLIRKIICIALIISLITSFVHAFSFTNGIVRPTVFEIQKSIEEKYGLNIILPQNSNKYINIEECMTVVESSLNRFPDGVIKEITDSYLNKGIKTNLVINKTDNNLIESPATYRRTNSSVNITINILTNNFYGASDVVSLDGIMFEISHFICDYLFDVYGYDNLELGFNKLNLGYEYGTWGLGYDKVFINQSSATNLSEDISDLIWYAENYPEKVLNVSLGKKETIHNKVEFLAQVMDICFESVTPQTKLWLDSIPGSPDVWAENDINKMFEVGLIPKDFLGMYESYISREDFCTLALNLVKLKIGEDKFYQHFEISKPQKSLVINPVNGEIIIDDIISDVFYDINLCKNKDDIYEAYKIGLISDFEGNKFNPEAQITRLEAAKISTAICEKFGIEISEYDLSHFDDMTDLSELEKPYIYFAVSRGILRGYSNKIMPNEYCTYQEAYIMLNRVYELNN